MSCRELIESLKKGADERIRQLWQNAEVEAGRMQSENRQRREQLGEEAGRKQTLIAVDRLNQAVAQANSRARIITLCAEKALSDRLYAIATKNLPVLRKSSYEILFGALARELPSIAWECVQVHPDDIPLAKKYFPGAVITTDAGITGGMVASARDGAIRAINTFEKRLERAWPEMLPELIRDAYLEVKDEGASGAAGGPGISGRISSDQNQGQAVTADH